MKSFSRKPVNFVRKQCWTNSHSHGWIFRTFVLWYIARGSSIVSAKCKIDYFELTYKSGKRTELQEMHSPRIADYSIVEDGHYVCYEDFGDTIQAVIDDHDSKCDSSSIKRVSFDLMNKATGKSIVKRDEYVAPYYLFGDHTATSVRYGQTLKIGRYTLQSSVYEKLTNGTVILSDSKAVTFNVIDCLFTQPANECRKCGQGSVCFGSVCVHSGYVRISLSFTGDAFWDIGLAVRTPLKTTIAAFPFYDSKDVVQYDTMTGGYVDTNNYDFCSCKERGVFVKNIIFPSSEQTPGGKYTISLIDIETCYSFFGGGNSGPSYTGYELQVHVNNKLIGSYKEGSKREITFEL